MICSSSWQRDEVSDIGQSLVTSAASPFFNTSTKRAKSQSLGRVAEDSYS